MTTFLLQAVGPFGASLVMMLIALGIIAMLREGTGDEDRRSFSSSAASLLGLLGIVSIPVVAVTLLWSQFFDSLSVWHVPTLIGSSVGVLLSIGVLGRAAFYPRRRRYGQPKDYNPKAEQNTAGNPRPPSP